MNAGYARLSGMKAAPLRERITWKKDDRYGTNHLSRCQRARYTKKVADWMKKDPWGHSVEGWCFEIWVTEV